MITRSRRDAWRHLDLIAIWFSIISPSLILLDYDRFERGCFWVAEYGLIF